MSNFSPEYMTKKTAEGHNLLCICCQRQINVCSECGKYRFPGDWPQCPHGEAHFGEEPLEPYVDENILANGKDVGYDLHGNKVIGTLITSRGQRSRIMQQEGLEFRKKKEKIGRVRYFDYGRH